MSEEIVEDTLDEVETPEAQESEPKSMDDTIRETLEAIESRGSEDETETPEQKAERVRDEKGRFAPKDAAPEAESVPPPTEVDTPPVAAPVVVPPEVQRLGLRKDEAEAFATASEAVKAAFVRRSEEMHKGLEQFRSKAQFGDAMERAVTPFAATIQAMGIHPAEAVQKLMAADHSLRYGTPEQKQQMFARMAQQYGVDLGQVSQVEQPYVDPNVSALQQQVQQLHGWIQQRTMAEEQRDTAALNSEIQRFSIDPANKHFGAVVNDMVGLIQSGIVSEQGKTQRQVLEEAYERAIYANPTVRAQVLAEQQAQADARRKAEANQKAQEAKRAAAVNVTRRGVSPVKRPVGTMEETIRATAERLGVL